VFRDRSPHLHPVRVSGGAAGQPPVFGDTARSRRASCFQPFQRRFRTSPFEQEAFQVDRMSRVIRAACSWECRTLGKLAATFLFFRHLSHVRTAIDGGLHDVR
jgi:hypothetical protein